MESRQVLWSEGGRSDEWMTPAFAVKPLLKYVHPRLRIWCPFDTAESNFVKVFREAGREVVHSHICDGQDFFEYEPERWDVLISNPPFSNKRKFFERALALGKPFALLMTNTWLNDAAPKQLFAERDLQLLMFEQRIRFQSPSAEAVTDKITFSSSYYCTGLLPKQLIMERLPKE